MSAKLTDRVINSKTDPEANLARALLIENIRDVATRLLKDAVAPRTFYAFHEFTITDKMGWPTMVFDVDKVRILYLPDCDLVEFPSHWYRWKVYSIYGDWESRYSYRGVLPRLRWVLKHWV